MLRRFSGQTARRLAPRSMAALEEVARLRQEVAELRASIDEMGEGLQESRAQALRVGQLTDLVFARLADAGTTAERPSTQSRDGRPR